MIRRIAVVLAVVVLLFGGDLVRALVDWLWFDALGYEAVFLRALVARVALWLAGAGLVALVAGLALRRALAISPPPYLQLALELGQADSRALTALVRIGASVAVALPALAMGGAASARWAEVLAYLHRVPFGEADPVFGHDVSFYVFALPVLELARTAIGAALAVALGVSALAHLGPRVALQRPLSSLPDAARRQLGRLAALLALDVAAGHVLARYELLFQRRGAVFGAGYADVHAAIPVEWAMAVAALVVAGTLALRWRSLRAAGAAVAAYVALSIVGLGLVPRLVQDYVVRPNELQAEEPYLRASIEATRRAYGLDRVEVRPFDPEEDALTLADIRANAATVDNIRLWDVRPLRTTYKQLQEIRLYYDFVDVDVDRYVLGGRITQVMLAGRELNVDRLPARARSWLNEHLQFTHGYGLAMSPVNVVTEEGLPELVVRDIPPVATVDLRVERPEIYYGELTDRYVFVRTDAQEFDFPKGDDNVYSTYAGTGGIVVGGALRRALLALYLRSFDVLLTDYLRPDSRLLLHRTVADRVRRLAPFLRLDHDPYLVVADGRLVWLLDAYTTTNRYPYSEPYRDEALGRLNYIRNSVKVAVDAYDGSIRLYVADPADPLLRAWAAVFPGLFRPLDEMPDSLRAHLRHPVDLFSVQAEMYRAYHMTDPTVFYNREDMWELPKELYGGEPQVMRPYYLVMRLPDAERPEFILLVPFTPSNRDNMIAWLAARSDPPNRGRLLLYQFPKQRLVYGPRQIEARIDQDPEISELITLWSQAGSRVVRGNLLVIPIERSLLYVEPLYLQAESGQLPELKRIIVAYGDRLAMRPTLEEALLAVFGMEGAAAPAEGEAGDEEAAGDWRALAARAARAFRAAGEARAAGDWRAYGDRLADLAEALGALARMAGAEDEEAAEAVPGLSAPGRDAPPAGGGGDAPPGRPSPAPAPR